MHSDHSHHHEHDHDHEHHHEKTFADVVEFHGHTCPGLTLGYRAAEIAVKRLGTERDIDEELVAVVENDACGIDAIQVITGCTVGKGNLILLDHGKHVYTFINRETGKAIRIAQKDFNMDDIDPVVSTLRLKVMSGNATEAEEADFHRRMQGVCNRVMALPDERLFDIKEVEANIPEKARIFQSVKCAKCGESVAEHRARVMNGGFVCIPCYEEYTRGWGK